MLLLFPKDNVKVLLCIEILAVTFSHLFGAGAHISYQKCWGFASTVHWLTVWPGEVLWLMGQVKLYLNWLWNRLVHIILSGCGRFFAAEITWGKNTLLEWKMMSRTSSNIKWLKGKEWWFCMHTVISCWWVCLSDCCCSCIHNPLLASESILVS